MSWGEIYNTSWWGVALDTARTVKARPDFFGSQLNLLTSEQPNLVVNGTFDTDTDWIKNTNWSISGGVAIADGTTNDPLFQNGVVSSGKFYKVSFEIKSISQGSFYLDLGISTTGQYYSSIGTYTEYIKAGTTNNRVYIRCSGNTIGSIDNVSVQVERAELDQIEAKKCLADWIHTTALKDLNN